MVPSSEPEPTLETLSQRELRNESGRVLRAVARGESFILTNGGVVVGKIVPIDAPMPTLTITRPAIRIGGWQDLDIEVKEHATPLSDVMEELRQERA